VNGAVVGTATTAPYSVSWDSTTLADQVVSVSARAYDTAGNTSVAVSQMETVANSVPLDTVAPTVSITSPMSAAAVNGSVALTAQGSDDDQVANAAADTTTPVSMAACNASAGAPTWYTTAVSVALSATNAGSGLDVVRYTTDGSTPTPTNGTTYSSAFSVPASAIVLYRAYDKAGNAEAINSLPLLVDTVAPTGVKITSPVGGAVLTGVKPIVSASADNVGVVRVTFYVDNVFIGARVTLPMQWN
jgi:Chitobiase/beta-hexosaminidase C-terminal domain